MINPAIDKNGNKFWKNENGDIHREDGPAIEWFSGNKEWWINNKLHRENNPAVEWNNGTKEWYLDNKRHREDGPAIEYCNGIKAWYKNGLLHRVNGPAVECPNGYKSWHIEGKQYSEEEYNKKIKEMNFLIIDKFGTKIWFDENNQKHRDDGPAVEFSNGNKEWWIHGKRHREDGPALELLTGDKYWYTDDKLHREYGPAIEFSNGKNKWYLDGVKYTEEQHYNKISETNNMKVDSVGNKRWYNKDNQLHRLDGPAVEFLDGTKYWYKNGERHRLDGPAVEYSNGDKVWYIEGKLYSEEEFNNKISETKGPITDKYGNKFWKNENGQLHKEDGPAVEFVNGNSEWYINGKKVSEKDHQINFLPENKTCTSECLNDKIIELKDPINEIIIETVRINGRLYKLVD